MKTIGITYDLRDWYIEKGFSMIETTEFDKISTISGIETELIRLGFEVDRIGNIFELVQRLSQGDRWDLVFNIAECMYGDGRESAIPALLDQYKIPYVFSGPVVMGISLNKYYSKLLVEAAGVPVSPGRVIKELTELDDLMNEEIDFPVFLKPVAEGTGKGITTRSLVNSKEELMTLCTELLNDYNQPVLIEEFLPGREFTVGILGHAKNASIIGGMEIICKDGLPYSNEVKENYEEFASYLPIDDEVREECYAVALKSWIALGGVDAGRIDLRINRAGKVCFIEANPLAGLNPHSSDLPILSRMCGKDYSYLIENIINSALLRNKLTL